MKQTDPGSASISTHACRRRAVRLKAPIGLFVTFHDSRISATVVDIGVGGLCVDANAPLRRDVLYQFTLRHGTHELTCEARPAHCRPRVGGIWAVGLSFECADRQGEVEAFIDSIMNGQIEFS